MPRTSKPSACTAAASRMVAASSPTISGTIWLPDIGRCGSRVDISCENKAM